MRDTGIRAGVRRLFKLALRRPEFTRQDVDDEIAIHIALRTEHLVRHGWSEPEAHMEAERRFGEITTARHLLRQDALRRDRRLGLREWLGTVGQDAAYALRQMRRHPGFTVAAVMMLALGIGANVTIFSFVNAALLRPPAQVAEPERLVSLFTSDFSGPTYGSSSLPDVDDMARARDVFSSVSAYAPRPVGVGTGDDLERVGMELVSANYFRTLGVVSQAGRFFSDDEGRPNSAPVAVISDALWRRRFGADRGIVGGDIRLNGRVFTVTGIAPAGFVGSLRGIGSDVWVPLALGAPFGTDASDLTERGDRGYFIVARLASGMSATTAQARMDVLSRELLASYPQQWTDVTKKGRRLTVVEEKDARIPPMVRGPVLGFVGILIATVGLVLLVCCANVAGLLLARAAGRGREMAVRLSLGAARARLVRQLLTESILLALLGGVGGVLLTFWATGALAQLQLPVPVTVSLDLSPDLRVLAFAAAIALGTGVLFGLAPALQASRLNLVTALKAEGQTVQLGGRRISLQSALVAGQVAASLLLIAGALLFVQSLVAATRIDPGFDPRQMLIAELEPRLDAGRRPDYRERTGAVALEMQHRVAALGGVRAVTWASYLPLSSRSGRRGIRIRGYTPRDGEDMEFHFSAVGPSYFETFRVPLMRGRDFSEKDRPGAPLVMVVNETFARTFWPNANPIGQEVSLSGSEGPWLQVVGLARDGKYMSLGEAPTPFFWYAALQRPEEIALQIRTAGDPMSMLPAVRRELASVAPDWEVRSAQSMEAQVGASLLPQRVAGLVLSLFGTVALFLAAVGLYGVIAQGVARRTREIGVRMALGASGGAVRALVFRSGMRLVGLGIAVGVPIAWIGARLLQGFLLGSSGVNVFAFAGAAVLLAVVAALAIVIPASRAVSVDPMSALRSE
ncbi:MAG: ABC transporter permease [Gemmatimonadaceae bacterium]